MTSNKKQHDLKTLNLWERIDFFSQFQTYLSSSIPLTTALVNMGKHSNNAKTRLIARILLKDIDNGEDFSDAILKFKKSIGGIYCNLMAVGAQAGELPKILKQIHDMLKKQRQIIYTIIQQSAYPLFMFLFMLIPSMGALLFYIGPKMADQYRNFYGDNLPATLSMLTNVMLFLSQNWIFIILFCLALLFGTIKLLKNIADSKLGVELPFFGKIIQNYNLSRFSKLLAISYSAGLPITHGLLLASESISNKYMQKILFKCSSQILRNSLTDTFANTHFFSPSMLSKIQAGEMTGEIDRSLNEISENIDEALETAISSLLKIIEPLLLVIMAVMIVFYGTTMMNTIFMV